MTDDRLDGRPMLEVALDLGRQASFLASGVDVELVLGRSIVAAVSGIGNNAIEHIADEPTIAGMTFASVWPS
jgi:hypothetical protein